MDIFTADTTSLAIIRKIRLGCDVALAQTQIRDVADLGIPYARLSRLGIAPLCNSLRIPEKSSLRLFVPNENSRRRCKGIRSVIRNHRRGENPFLEVVSSDANHPSELLPKNGRLFVESPESLVLSMASRLSDMERIGTYSSERTRLMLLKLCLELCGLFTHDPVDPWKGDARYNIDPVMTSESLSAFLGGLTKIPGLPLAREVASWVYDKSGSPEESFLGVALFGPTALGGLSLGEFDANKPIALTPEQLRVLDERRITPDLSMTSYRLGIEFKGKIHEEGDNPEKDRHRSLDFQTVSWLEFAFWYRDVRTQEQFNRSAARIVSAIEQYEGPAVRHRFEKMVNDSAFLAKQRTIFEVFRPWLREMTS